VTLAETELDAKNYAAAEAAADRALQANPRSIEAMIFKGRAIMERASANKLPASAWDEARRWFMAANKLDTEDPEPLLLFHHSFERQGVMPTPNAAAALHYALALAPQDADLRLRSAFQHLREGKTLQARRTLMPIAWHPHRKGAAGRARELIKLLSEGKAREALQLAAKESEEEEDGER
jgi:predicted Zn-dependent protease